MPLVCDAYHNRLDSRLRKKLVINWLLCCVHFRNNNNSNNTTNNNSNWNSIHIFLLARILDDPNPNLSVISDPNLSVISDPNLSVIRSLSMDSVLYKWNNTIKYNNILTELKPHYN